MPSSAKKTLLSPSKITAWLDCEHYLTLKNNPERRRNRQQSKETSERAKPETSQEEETESLEARVETEKKSVDDTDEAEGSFMSVDAAEKRNVKSSDLKLDETVEDIQEDEFTCTICFLVLKKNH